MDSGLQRFLRGQEGMYGTALAELNRGKKESHWIWYIFPQLRGLGYSENAMYYGISGQEEAKAYLAHPVLRQRLEACCQAMLRHRDLRAEEILGELDAIKFHSSMTLFAYVSENGSVFHKALDRFFLESMDRRTVNLLEAENAANFDPHRQVQIPEGVTDVEDWTAWVRQLYRRGKRDLEVRVARRIIEDLLKNGHSEAFLKEFRTGFDPQPDGVAIEDVKLLMLLAESDYDQAYDPPEAF